MDKENLDRLKEVLAVPTYSRNEVRMIEYLKSVFDEKGFEYYLDKLGNIYVTKGEAEYFPCFVAHTDTVHEVNEDMRVVQLEEDGKTILTGIDIQTMKPSGIGGDDKCGVYLCLEMLDKLDNVKVALFVSEEIGCVGSRQADPKFFENVGYAIQYDSPKGNSMSMTLMGKELFGTKTVFGEKVSPLILEHGIDDWAYHPYTDIWPLMDKFGFSCLNLAAGYYNYHTHNEYVLVSDVDNAFELGIKLHQELGENYYDRPKNIKTTTKSYSDINGGYYGGKYYDDDSNDTHGNGLMSEDVDDDPIYDNGTLEIDGVVYDEYTEEDFSTDLDDTFEDLFDYKEFNGGNTIEHYGTRSDFDDVSDTHQFEW